MLTLRVGGEKMTLPADMEMTINGENPFLTEERIPMTNSFPANFPAGKENLRILGYPTRLTSLNVPRELPGEILMNERLVERGAFVVESAGETLEGYFKGMDANERFSTMLCDLPLHLTSGVVPSTDAECMSYNRTPGLPFIFAPIRLSGDITRGGALSTWRNYLNYYVGLGHILRDYMPAIRVSYLLDEIIGPKLATNPFKEGVYKNLVVQTLQLKDWEYPNLLAGRRAQDFLPKIEASKFVSDLLKMFCMTIVIRHGEYHIIANKDLTGTTSRRDWSDRLEDGYTLTRERGKLYKYGYSDVESGVAGDSYRTVSTVVELRNLETENTGDTQRFRITETGQLVDRVRNPSSVESRWLYVVADSGFGGSDGKAEEEYDATTSLRPMDMALNTILRDQEASSRLSLLVPQVNVSELSGDKMPRIMFFKGMNEVNDDYYPLLTPYRRNTSTNETLGAHFDYFDLRWDFSQWGLIDHLHRDWKAWIEKDKLTLRGSMRWSVNDLVGLNYLDKYYIKGKDFYLRSWSAPLKGTRIGMVDVEFVEA